MGVVRGKSSQPKIEVKNEEFQKSGVSQQASSSVIVRRQFTCEGVSRQLRRLLLTLVLALTQLEHRTIKVKKTL